MNRTKIPWCDWTWNPIVGCSPASEGCANCYAAAISKRFHLPWGKARFMPERLDQPAKVHKPGRVFVCSMGDLFHETVSREWKQAVFTVACNTPRHTFIFLTKRPERVRDWWIGDVPNVWLGVTAENQARADECVPILADIPAAVRFVSIEPMLGPVSMRRWLPEPCAITPREPCGDCEACAGNASWPTRIHWVIAGPETGPGARECRDEWIEALARESSCFFDKRQRGHWVRREFPNAHADREPASGDTVGRDVGEDSP